MLYNNESTFDIFGVVFRFELVVMDMDLERCCKKVIQSHCNLLSILFAFLAEYFPEDKQTYSIYS